MRRLNRTALPAMLRAALLLTIAACELTHDPLVQYLPEKLSVHGVLVAGDTQARVLVARISPRDTAVGIVPVVGARVRLSSATEMLTLTTGEHNCIDRHFPNVNLNQGCYAAQVPGGLRAGVRYHLEVETPDLGNAEGWVTMPAPPGIMAPVAGARVRSRQQVQTTTPEGAFTVRWSGVPTGQWVEIRVRQFSRQCTLLMNDVTRPFGTDMIHTISSDSVSLWLYDGSCQINDGPLPAEIALLAYDSAYTIYRENLARLGHASANVATGITGAVGVFAGAARAAVPIVVGR